MTNSWLVSYCAKRQDRFNSPLSVQYLSPSTGIFTCKIELCVLENKADVCLRVWLHGAGSEIYEACSSALDANLDSTYWSLSVSVYKGFLYCVYWYFERDSWNFHLIVLLQALHTIPSYAIVEVTVYIRRLWPYILLRRFSMSSSLLWISVLQCISL